MPSDRDLARGTLEQFLATGDGCFLDNADADTLREMVRLSAAATARPDWDMRQELWECYCASGADPDGADARHLNAGEALRAVQELRDNYNEALEEVSLGEGEGGR